MPAHRVEPMGLRHPVVVVEGPERAETGPRAVHHGHRDRPVERHDRPRGDGVEHVVQREDLRPVRLLGARCFVVDRGDRRLQLVRADRRRAERARDERHPFLDLRSIPAIALLLRERDDGAVRTRPRCAAGIGQEHEREQAGDLRLAGQRLVQHPRQTDRFGGERAPVQGGARGRRVALVEDEVEHVQHDGEPLGSLGLGRQVEPETGAPDALLRAADPLRHRRFRDQEGVRDLRRRQPADGSQREGELRRHGQRWMAAEEQERERVVAVGEPAAVRRGSSVTAVSSRARRALSLRQPSIRRREATVTSHARGSSGTPSSGHWSEAASRASCTASSDASNRP